MRGHFRRDYAQWTHRSHAHIDGGASGPRSIHRWSPYTVGGRPRKSWRPFCPLTRRASVISVPSDALAPMAPTRNLRVRRKGDWASTSSLRLAC